MPAARGLRAAIAIDGASQHGSTVSGVRDFQSHPTRPRRPARRRPPGSSATCCSTIVSGTRRHEAALRPRRPRGARRPGACPTPSRARSPSARGPGRYAGRTALPSRPDGGTLLLVPLNLAARDGDSSTWPPTRSAPCRPGSFPPIRRGDPRDGTRGPRVQRARRGTVSVIDLKTTRRRRSATFQVDPRTCRNPEASVLLTRAPTGGTWPWPTPDQVAVIGKQTRTSSRRPAHESRVERPAGVGASPVDLAGVTP
jgi:hypothetical protein